MKISLLCPIGTCLFKCTYFVSYFSPNYLSSITGLLTATVSSEVFKAAQPALLYLVPFTLLPLLSMAYLKVKHISSYLMQRTPRKNTIILFINLLIFTDVSEARALHVVGGY